MTTEALFPEFFFPFDRKHHTMPVEEMKYALLERGRRNAKRAKISERKISCFGFGVDLAETSWEMRKV